MSTKKSKDYAFRLLVGALGILAGNPVVEGLVGALGTMTPDLALGFFGIEAFGLAIGRVT